MNSILGSGTEEEAKKFILKLDQDKNLGPKPIEGFSYSTNDISDVIGCSDEIALELFRKPTPFLTDENGEVYVIYVDPNSGEEVELYLTSDKSDPSYDLAVKEIGLQLPELTFDIECGGYPSRQTEAASFYKVCVISAVQEGQYKEEISNILSKYDFERWCSNTGEYEFTRLLQTVQEEADSISKIILMCSNIKLLADRVKKDTSYKDILQAEDAEKLRILTERDALINIDFNKRYGSALNIKEKILIGEQLADERAKLLSQSFVSDDIKILFKIFNLNQNCIPGRAKRLIRNSASTYLAELNESKAFKDEESSNIFKKKLIQRAQKLYLSRMKEIRYKCWSARTPDMDLNSLLPKY
jgi:hypothetical protein